jgi:hypothetical protein
MLVTVQCFASPCLADERQTLDDMNLMDEVLLVPKDQRCELLYDE